MNNVNDLRNNDFLTDFIIINKGREFKCHKVILAGASDYFHALLSVDMAEANSSKVTFNYDTDILEMAINFIYKQDIKITDETIVPIFEMARYLQIKDLIPKCDAYLKDLLQKRPNSKLLDLVYIYEVNDVITAATKTLTDSFETVFTESVAKYVFLRYSHDELKEYIKDRTFKTTNPYNYVRGIQMWCLHDPEARTSVVKEVLDEVNAMKCDMALMLKHKEVNTGNSKLNAILIQLHLQIAILNDKATVDLITLYALKHIDTIILA